MGGLCFLTDVFLISSFSVVIFLDWLIVSLSVFFWGSLSSSPDNLFLFLSSSLIVAYFVVISCSFLLFSLDFSLSVSFWLSIDSSDFDSSDGELMSEESSSLLFVGLGLVSFLVVGGLDYYDYDPETSDYESGWEDYLLTG